MQSQSQSQQSQPDSWSISVKTVGAQQQESCFQVDIGPDESIQALHERIATITGWPACEQRLIYRGRLIVAAATTASKKEPDSDDNHNNHNRNNNHNNSRHQDSVTKLSEIQGLTDGQTIHLVRRMDNTASSSTLSSSTATTATTNNSSTTTTQDILASEMRRNNNNNENNDATSATNPNNNSTSSFLAALLGLTSLDEEEVTEEGTATATTAPNSANANTTTTTPRTTTAASPRLRRYARRTRPSHRLTEQDLQVPDPGSMESVRQGLLTLHTLLPVTQQQLTASSSTSVLETVRPWYLGQWIDCRDTVNQWLEATIVEIVHPDDIVPHATSRRRTSPTVVPVLDPAVGARDWEGRRRLLLEPCPSNDDDLGDGYRPRDTNQHVVLLKIHYNGWPHRWDEWIRSDSERIRPFCVRTRHGGPHVSPTTQSHYADSPGTWITGNIGNHNSGDNNNDDNDNNNEEPERAALLHELGRVTSQIQTLMEQAAGAVPVVEAAAPRPFLPWNASVQDPPEVENELDVATDYPPEELHENDETNEHFQTQDAAHKRESNNNNNNKEGPTYNPQTSLALLAPLLDRLGRTLVDAAPHVASLAAAQAAAQVDDADQADVASEDNETLSSLIAAASTQTMDSNNNNDDSNTAAADNPNSLGGLLSMLNRERRRNSRTSQSQVTDQALTHASGESIAATTTTSVVSAPPPLDPDLSDFATGMVNVTRGEVRAGPRSRRQREGSSEELGGLLGAYLAAASLGGLGSVGGGGDTTDLQRLGRLLSTRGDGENGSGGSGIDIHIHAVVTAPGMTPAGGGGGGGTLLGGTGGLGVLGLGTTEDAAAPPDLFANTRRATAERVRATLLEQNDVDEEGIFDDLYSENPTPALPSSHEQSTSETNEPSTSASSSSSSSPSRRSSRRRDAGGNHSQHGGNNNNNGGSSSSNNNSSSHRSSLFGRFFRRGGAPDS